jgi:hypothetical protein
LKAERNSPPTIVDNVDDSRFARLRRAGHPGTDFESLRSFARAATTSRSSSHGQVS